MNRTFTVVDLCGNSNSCVQAITLEAPAVAFNAPAGDSSDGCEFDDASGTVTLAQAQQALTDDIAAWVTAQTTAIQSSFADGCNPTVSSDFTGQTLDYCTDGSVTITWTVEDLCGSTDVTATYTYTAPAAVAFNAPAGDSSDGCEFDDASGTVTLAQAQQALTDDIAAWVTAQTTAIQSSFADGCNPTVSSDFTGQTLDYCTDGSVTITWTVEDLCGSTDVTATYTYTAPAAVAFNAPAGDSSDGCEFDDASGTVTLAQAQQALTDDIAAWVTAQTTAIQSSFADGCNPTVSSDFTGQTLDYCTDGSVTITWTVEDLCGSTDVTATYTYTAPTAVAFNAPAGDSSDGCEFDDASGTVTLAQAQQALTDDIAAWVAAQTTAIQSSFADGCNPTVSSDFTGQTLDYCTDGSVTITWTVEDLCGSTDVTATYTYTAPAAVAFNAPAGDSSDGCEFDDASGTVTLAQAQQALTDDIAAWVTAQTTAIQSSFADGCNPTVSSDFTGQTLDYCTDGSVTITWTVEDLCGSTDVTATYTYTAPAAVAFNAPAGDSSDGCEFDDASGTVTLAQAQQALTDDIAAWVTAQTTAIQSSFADGCNPTVSSDFTGQTLDYCTDGSVTITWTVEDLCGSTDVTATYTYTAPAAVAFNAPAGDSSDGCEFDDASGTVTLAQAQQALTDDIAAWVTAQTTAIQSSFADGCNPTVSSDFTGQTLDYCTDGSVTITWTVEDLCGSTDVTATYTYTAPAAVAFNAPAGDSSDGCEFDDASGTVTLAQAQQALTDDIAAWVTAQTTAYPIKLCRWM